MLIKLRQSEIEEALQQYIVSQGINLTGKTVKIDFTASRSSDGLTADVDISNGDHTTIPAGAISRTSGEVGTAETKQEKSAEEEPKEPEQEALSSVAPAEEEAPAVAGNSLFS